MDSRTKLEDSQWRVLVVVMASEGFRQLKLAQGHKRATRYQLKKKAGSFTSDFNWSNRMVWMPGECNVQNEEAIWPGVSKPRKEMDDHTFLWFLTMADIQMKLSEYLERHRFPQYFIGLCPLTSCCPTSTLIFERWLFKARVWKSISCLLEASSNPSLPGEVPN